jgi:type IX secretion system PorP/SprF family membrane protein
MFQSGSDGGFRSAMPDDPSIDYAKVSGSALDLGAGVYYNTQDVYIGISSAHLTEPTIEWSDGKDYNMERHYFLIAGYTHDLNPMLLLHPSIYLKSDGATSQLDINTSLIYNNKMWGGVSYRLDEGLVFLTGLNVNEDLKLGLAYDVVLNQIGNNSIEVMLGYNFKVNYNKAISKYKNPRFL